MEALQTFKDLFSGLYRFMTTVQLPVFMWTFSLWDLFLFLLVGGALVWFIRELLH